MFVWKCVPLETKKQTTLLPKSTDTESKAVVSNGMRIKIGPDLRPNSDLGRGLHWVMLHIFASHRTWFLHHVFLEGSQPNFPPSVHNPNSMRRSRK